jgi:hypothetical protein
MEPIPLAPVALDRHQSAPGAVYPSARAHHIAGDNMLKFIGGTVGVIFLIGLIVVVLLLKLIF